MPSTDTKPELTAKASMAQPVSQPAVYANGLTTTLPQALFGDVAAYFVKPVTGNFFKILFKCVELNIKLSLTYLW
jgi:hypothetical protein